MLKGKAALVTGSTSGIGLAIARRLAKNGADIMLNGFGETAAIEKARAGIESEFGVKVAWSGADLSQPAAVTGLVEYTVRRLGGIDILCNNAGIRHAAPIERFPPEKWEAILAVDLSSAFHAIRAAVPLMRKKSWGRIVSTALADGPVASAERAAYAAAVFGLVGLTKVVALETAGSGITCNAICPGFMQTDTDRLRQTSRQFATVDQFADEVAILCSDAGAAITGAAMPPEGGWTAK